METLTEDGILDGICIISYSITSSTVIGLYVPKYWPRCTIVDEGRNTVVRDLLIPESVRIGSYGPTAACCCN
jgi:hypothetical protein